MKKSVLGLLFAGMAAANAFSQSRISLGPVVSAGVSKTCGMENSKLNQPSYSIGASIIYSRNANWAFGTDLVYSQEGYNASVTRDSVLTREIGFVRYIRLNPKLIYFFNSKNNNIRPKVYLSPSLGYKVSEDIRLKAINYYTRELRPVVHVPLSSFNNFDLGATIGVGVNCKLGNKTWLNADLGYYQGFVDVLLNGNFIPHQQRNTNSNLRAQIGILFSI